MEKKLGLFLLLLSFCFTGFSQEETTCAPVKDGKICYSDQVRFKNMSKERLYDAVNKWAAKTYGTDIFFSNVSSNRNRGTVLISSKMELLLNETEKTYIKFRIRINCSENLYTVDITDIVYQYDPYNERRFKTYPAENVILKEGKGNTVEVIKNPLLFCEATHDFAEMQMSDLFEAVTNKK